MHHHVARKPKVWRCIDNSAFITHTFMDCCGARYLLLSVVIVELLLMVIFRDKCLSVLSGSSLGKNLSPSTFRRNQTNIEKVLPSQTVKSKEANNTQSTDYSQISTGRIFYNVFVSPKLQQGVDLAESIISADLKRIRESFINENPWQIHYITIGVNGSHVWIQELCTQFELECVHVEHHSAGNEYLTLTAIHEFCQTAPQGTRVSYIHSKGTFHPSEENFNWGRAMTSAVTNSLCRKPPNASCNLCGLQFYPIWTAFMNGNFWTADCSYIKKLVPPAKYGKLVLKPLRNTNREFVFQLFPRKPWAIGTDRFSAEHWVGSHPDLRPCDLSKETDSHAWKHADALANKSYEFAMAPRHPIQSYNFNGTHQDNTHLERVLDDLHIRRRDYFLLNGLSFKWDRLYGKYPSETSWVWNFFPDGKDWKQMMLKNATLKNYPNLYVP